MAKSLDKLPHTTSHNTIVNEHRILRGIRDKLFQNNSMITKADKGQTLIIITKDAYEFKVHDFLHNNDFVKSLKTLPLYTHEKLEKPSIHARRLSPITLNGNTPI